MDSGLFSQQGSLDDDDNSQGSSQSTNQTLTCTPTASPADSQPLEDYTKYNASLPPAPPTKVSVICTVYIQIVDTITLGFVL